MGNWNITIQGTGQHHNFDKEPPHHCDPRDANKMAQEFLARLIEAGHSITSATITHGASDDLKTANY
jgi:hypothetical protein